MADVTISALPSATGLVATDKLELEQGTAPGNASTHATLGQIADFVAGEVGEGVPEAPSDGKLYGRKDGAWSEVPGGGQGGYATMNAQTGTAYTLVLADAGALVTMSNAAANTLTVPPNSAVAFPVGTRVDIGQDGAGQTTVAAGSGVTIRTPETLKLRKQWGKATLIKRAADTWDLEGNLEAAP